MNGTPQIKHYSVLSSTNDEAKRLARAGAQELTVVYADKQTHGRGRLQRDWYSPSDSGLYMSLILRPQFSTDLLPLLSLVSGVALCRTLDLTGIKPRLKWPNDVFIQDRKLAGILSEAVLKPHRVVYAVIGVGLNIKIPQHTHSDWIDKAAFLETLTSNLPDRETLIARFLSFWSDYYGNQQWKLSTTDLAKEWEGWCAHLRKTVILTIGDKTIEGLFLGIQPDGHARIQRTSGEIQTFLTGECSLRES